jgi:hypothetical protein
MPFEESEHDAELHFECELGETHYAIFQSGSDEPVSAGAIALAFAIDDMNDFVKILRQEGISPASEPIDRGFGTLASIVDPDGNRIDVTQLSPQWLQYLRERRLEQPDPLESTLRSGS